MRFFFPSGDAGREARLHVWFHARNDVVAVLLQPLCSLCGMLVVIFVPFVKVDYIRAGKVSGALPPGRNLFRRFSLVVKDAPVHDAWPYFERAPGHQYDC